MSQLNFDATHVQPETSREAIPAGDYPVLMLDSAMKPTKNGQGEYLEMTFQVLDGPHQGRLLWERLTLIHTNAKTVEIAQRQLSAICHAVGVMQVADSAQLHNLPMIARVKYLEDPTYGPKNEISAFKPMGQRPHAAAPVQQPLSAAGNRMADASHAAPGPWAQQQPAPQQQPAAPWAQQPQQLAQAPQPAPAPVAAAAPPWAQK